MRFASRKTRINNQITLFKALKVLSGVFSSAKLSKLTAFILLLATCLSLTYYVYAQTRHDPVVTINTINVFPSKIRGDGWHNLETLTFQNLDSFSLYQDFNEINSAYPNEAAMLRLQKKDKVEEMQPSQAEPESLLEEFVAESDPADSFEQLNETPNDQFATSSLTASTTYPVNMPETEVLEETETSTKTAVPAEELVEDVEPELETGANEEATSSISFRVIDQAFDFMISRVTKVLPLLSATGERATTSVIESNEINVTDADTEEPAVEEEQLITETEVLGVATIVQSASLDPVTLVTATSTEDETADETIAPQLPSSTSSDLAVTATTSNLENTTETVTDIVSVPGSNNLPASTTNTSVPTVCEEDCVPYEIELSDFGVPIFDEVTTLSGAQLRLSFAAKRKATRDAEQSLAILYSLDHGESWVNSGTIAIGEEASNSINGGYYLFSLPAMTDPALLDSLQIKIVYDQNPTDLAGLFVESAWLELFTIENPDAYELSAHELLADDGFNPVPPSGDTLVLPDGTEIEFTNTDENNNETLIVKSNEVTYEGLSKATAYVNVTNTSNNEDDFTLKAYFPERVGEVLSVQEWNPNKPKTIVVPEYRPFVYHCASGWEQTDSPIGSSLQDISRELTPENILETLNQSVISDDSLEMETVATATDDVVNWPTETESTTTVSTELESEPTVTSSTFKQATTALPLTQAVFGDGVASESEAEVASGATDSQVTAMSLSLEGATTTKGYVCRDTSVVRACDSLEGDNTACRMENVKVREHELTRYQGGWENSSLSGGEPEDNRSLFKKATDWLGFGPDIKDVPDEFEVRAHTPDGHTISPGETKYFKIEIEFPPFSKGEFWIEALGDSEYGLLDPFWNSQWQYRMPITIDNTAGANALTEYQVFLELDSSLTDFWSNVKNDGGDIRFVQETAAGNEEDWYGTGWGSRVPITIQSSQVDEDLTDFPVYVDLADLGSSFFSSVQLDGDDIRVTESDGLTEVPYELVTIDTGGETGELHFKASSVSSTTDTTFFIYHDNPNVTGYSETDTYGAQNVWGSEFIAVYHLEEAAAGRGTTGLYQDSTTNEYDADDELNSTGKSGQLGQGQEVDAQGDASEYILLPSDIVNGETDLTFSYWMNSSDGANQALVNGGANNEYLFYLTGGGTNFDVFPGGAVTVADLTNSTWRHVTVTRDSGANLWEVFVDGVSEGTDSTSLGTLSIPSDCLVVGLEQDTSCLNSGDTSQHLNASIDEMRFQNVIPSDGFIAATYRNQATTTDFYNVSPIETFDLTTFSELDHWVQHFSTSTDEADIWVQVDSLTAGASTTIYLYYGNSEASSASDEEATFTYSTTTDLYYVIDDAVSGPIEIYSLIDNNVVQIDGGSATALDEGETVSFATYSSTSVISALGPISATIDDAGGDSLAPISFATTTHVLPTNRNTQRYYIHAPFSSTTVTTYIANSGTPDETFSIATSSTRISNTDPGGSQSTIFEATSPVLVVHHENSGTNRDGFVAYPPTTRDIFGISTGRIQYSTLVDDPDPTMYCSGAASSISLTGLNRGDADTVNNNANCDDTNDGQGAASRITGALTSVTAIQQADGDGSESTAFWPQHEFGTQFYMPTDSAYVAVACSPRFGTSTIEVQTNGGTTVESATCAPSGEYPGKVYLDNAQGGDALAFTAGHQIVSTNDVPFYVIYEDDEEDNDETNILGSVQARKYDGAIRKNYTFGAQEINIDAEYEQLSFAWYQNADAQTPTSTWSLGEGSSVSEGEAITGQGAVSDGDILRLRINLQANSATGTASSSAFELQYAKANTCQTATTWFDIGEVGSTTAAFSGYNNASVSDGSIISTTTLSASTISATYEEASPSEFIPYEVPVNDVAEWDWVLTSSNADTNANYCFRMVRFSGDTLSAYTTYPELETSGPPSVPTLISFFDNERTATMTPALSFTTTDLSGDDLHYQVQISNSSVFGSTLVDRNSEDNFTEFENLNTPSDKAPFNSGAVVRFNSPTTLTPTSTYWWRVRARDPDGSDTWTDWSSPYSFTTWSTTTISEWHQTTDEQFETNSLTSATTSGSGSVELDIGSSVIGEYGSITVTNGATSTVNLSETYTTPVVVASVRYSRSVPNGDQVAARVFNKTGTTFDVLSDNYTADAPGTSTVDYVVMEAGEYLIDNGASGLRVYASSTSVSAYMGSSVGGDPGGPAISFPTTFSGNPTVLTMVTTVNDPDWVVSTPYDGTDVDNPPTASQMSLFLNDNLAADGHTAAEDIDFIAFDQGDGTNDSVEFDIANTGISSGVFVSDTPYTFSFSPAFSSTPGVTLVSMLTSNGGDGGYAMVDIDTPATASGVTVSVEEGGTAGARGHTEEDVGIVAFGSSGGTIIRAANAVVTSSPIDFDDAQTGNAWGEVQFTDSGSITYHVEYNTGSGFIDIPDAALAGNSTGFTTSPINILNLDTDTYNEIRLVAEMSGASPELFDWTVVWGQRVDIPTLIDPFDNQKIATVTPTFQFTTTDPEGDDLIYQISWSQDNTFSTGSTTRTSSTSANFANVTTPADTNPFNSGDTVSYETQNGEAFTNGETYWWRVRAKDPSGANSYSPWSDPDSFTVDTSVTVSTWFQTTAEQFQTGTLSGVSASTTGDFVTNDSTVGEFGMVVVDNGSTTPITTQRTYNDMVVVASVRYATTTETARLPRIITKNSNSFQVLVDNYDSSVTGTSTLDYIIMEAGDWLIEDGGSGMRVVADTYEDVSTIRANDVGDGLTGETISFSPNFSTAPAVLTTVSSNNDSNWVFSSVHSDDDVTLPPENDGFLLWLNRNFENASHDAEDVDYIAFEVGHGTNVTNEMDFVVSGDTVDEFAQAVSFNATFSTTPQTAVVQQVSQDGGNGGYAATDSTLPLTTAAHYVFIDEDGAGADRAHANEYTASAVFEGSSGLIYREDTDTDGTIAGQAIPFTLGSGPKFERYYFNATSTGGSTTTLQVQYQTATGSWELIPDSDIPGNSVGTTTGPVDLTSVDVVTYDTIRLLASLECNGIVCPTLNDWTLEWSEGVPVSGTIAEYDRSTAVTSGTVRAAVNNQPGNTGSIAGDGTWTINNVTAFAGDVVTVWVSSAGSPDERAVTTFVYDGIGDMTGVELYEQHLSIAADETGTTTNALIGAYDFSVSADPNLFFDVDDSTNDLSVCASGVSGCVYNNLYVGSNQYFIPDTTSSGNIATHDYVNDGLVEFDGNTVRVSGSWYDNATSSLDTSTAIFTATTSTETIDNANDLLSFNHLTFGETAGAATWQTADPLDIDGDLLVDYGTLDRSSSTINLAGDLTTNASGLWSGIATTTFDGTGTSIWTDANTTKQNLGYVVVDGSAKTATLASSVAATLMTIEANDTLNAGGANTLFLNGDFTNNNTFTAQTGTIEIIGVNTDAVISAGGSSLYNVTASTTGGGSISFTEPSITMLGDLTIATGTVTMPTATTSIGGSFLNTGGVFAHNNAAVRFTSSGNENIQLNGTTFLNHFYDVRFTGSGQWTFTDVNATTSNTFTITNGNVVLPSGQLSVAGDFTTSGGGAFDHNNGEVVLLIEGNDTVTANGSALNDVRVRQGSGSGAWYDSNWQYRLPITVRSSEVDDDLANFPVYVDLADLPSGFFSNLNSDGGDIRVTESDGVTEVPREVVNASTTALTGELYFEATTLSSTTDSTYYIYYGNSGASDYAVTATNGAENVWANGYVLVAHMNDETTSTVVNSADGTLDGTKEASGDPAETDTGQVYEAQDLSGSVDIEFGNVGQNATNITISVWFNADDLTGGGPSDNGPGQYGATIFSGHRTGNYTWLTAGGTGNGGSTDELRFCGFDSDAACDVTTGANLQVGEWTYVSATAVDGGATNVRVNGSTNVLTSTSNGGGTWNSESFIGDLRSDRNINFDGEIDEVQISNVVRSVAWQDATYRNQATSTDFYAVGSPQQDSVRTFADASMSAEGDVVIESGAAVFPAGTFNIGGSFDNDDEFDSNSGTVVFNGTTTGNTIAPGGYSFYNLTFNGDGDWAFSESASATNAITLTDVNTVTVNTGLTLESAGTFTNNLDNASTTWTGATLLLSGGTDFTINDKTSDGDDYNIITVTGDGDVAMWNSTSTVYNTVASSSIYSQDHNGNDGDLYIFGDYVREGGTEYWTSDTDFDGTALTGSTTRQVNVRVADGSFVKASSSILLITGSSSASTTIDAQSGDFTLRADNATVTAQYFSVTGTNADGFQLRSSSTVTLLDNALFTVPAASAGVTVDGGTINTNPAKQFFSTNFVSGGGAVNVTKVGSPSTYWWFRDGLGDLYGEDFDNADGNPGDIRWDDSSLTINVSGVVYNDRGITPHGLTECNGLTDFVRLVVGGTTVYDEPCSAADGSFTFTGVSVVGDQSIVAFLNSDGAGVYGATVSQTPTADITDFDIYKDRIITRHEDVTPLSIAEMAVYDFSDDSDIRFSAATGTTDTLTVLSDTELYLYASSTFTPDGVVTLQSGGTGNPYDGSLYLSASSTFVAVGTTTYSVGGSIFVEPLADLQTASSTFVMTATTTGKTITGSSTINFNELQFTGVGGGWNINSDITAASDIIVATGTVTGTGDITLSGGSFYGDGLVSLGGGTTVINRTNTLGGNQGWTFNNLTLGSGSVVGTTTPASNATTTVGGILTINAAHFLEAGGSAWNLTGSGNVFIETGNFLEATSTVQYGGTSNANILSTNYYNLYANAAAGLPTFTAQSTGFAVLNDLHVGGVSTTTLTLATNDPVVAVTGDILIAANGTFIGSDSTALTVSGSWDNNGTFTSSGGLVDFDSDDSFTIAAGDSSFGDVLISASGTATVSENATSTGDWTLASTSDFVVSAGQRLAVGDQFTNTLGGSATTWTGSVLHLYGSGQYEINASTTQDEYATLSAAAGTHVRTWNSSSTNYVTDTNGSIYSMDHNDVTGDLYIFGDYVQNTDTDYWNYATDFDGTDLSGGSERQVDVYVESGGSVTYGGGSLEIIGTSTASTTVAVQSTGDYSFDVSAGALNATYYEFTDLDSDGLTLTGSPSITSLSNGAWTLDTIGDAALTVAGSVIDQNPGKNILNNDFATTSGVSSAVNVRTTGSSVSSWRYNFHTGDVDGEDFDDDGGDPGYIVWDNSTTTYSIGGTVFQNDTSSPSSVCGGTSNIVLVVNTVAVASTTCNGSGVYLFEDINFDSNDNITVYINDEAQNAVAVTKEPISSIANLDLYEDHVIVRHENTDPLTIADMAIWDSSNDPADIIFTAVDAGSDTLTLPADTKLVIWDNKEFAPAGNITTGAGAGGALDGTVELQDDATFTLASGESHSIGGNLEAGTGAVFTPDQAIVTFTSGGSERTIDTNETGFYDLVINAVGSYSSNDTALTVANDLTLTNGTLTLPAATTTISGSLTTTGGDFVANNGVIVFDSTGVETITAAGSDFHYLTFDGTGSWSLNDANATATEAITIEQGTVTLPSGSLTTLGDFTNVAGTITHNTSNVILATTSAAVLQVSGSSLYEVTMRNGSFAIADNSLDFLHDFSIINATATLASGTLSLGGSFDSSLGVFDNASGTVLFNSSDTGEIVNPGNNDFYNVVFGSGSGGWTITADATTTNNFSLSAAADFTLQSGNRLYVANVFLNSVGGGATTWSNTTLVLDPSAAYTINTKAAGGDDYEALEIGVDADIRAWDSQATTTIIASSSSLYSQDHAGNNGDLYIYGDWHVATGTEYWSYQTDFDGTALGGSPRQVSVYHATSATTTVDGGNLQIVGVAAATTTIGSQNNNSYSFTVSDGTFNANYYSFQDLNSSGLVLTAAPTISDLSYGEFILAVDSGSLITLASSTLSANPSKFMDSVRFATTTAITGNNVNLNATTATAWVFRDHYGNLSGEDYDIDGTNDCGSVRWDDSSCLLVEQTHYRWRNDDGGLGVADSEWFNASWDKRQSIRVVNNDSTSYATTAVKMTVAYDSDMQGDFEDLRFTDSDGVTILPHWIERYTASTEATVWLKIPSLIGNSAYYANMYYDNVSATTTSSSTLVFVAVDDFEDNNLAEYSGSDITKFQTAAASAYGGSYGVEPVLDTDFTNDGIARFDLASTAQGHIIRYTQYIDTGSGASDEACALFGVQSPVSANNNFGVCLELFGTDRMSLVQDAERSDNYGAVTLLNSTNVSYSTGWYEIEIDWQADNTIDVYLYDDAGSLVATTSSSSAAYTEGGFGFTFWEQHGGWDSFTVRNRTISAPSVFFGGEQTDGGATWNAALDTVSSNFEIGDVARLRLAIENSGLDITDQEFRLEFAPKGVLPSCESVSAGSYTAVPVQSSCGSSAMCMATSSYFADGDAIADLLTDTNGNFTAGEATENPANTADSIDVDQNEYTELEYAVEVTVNATDGAYCFRVTDAGAELDSYAAVAEFSLQYTPVMDAVNFNNGSNISLIAGTTTRVYATTSVTDLNGYSDLSNATSTMYTTSATAACTDDPNNCYIETQSSNCSFVDCAGNTCTLECYADFFFHTDPTLSDGGEFWYAFLEVSDQVGNSDFATSPAIDVVELGALDVDESIDYGALAVFATTTAFANPSTTVQNLGNIAIDVNLEGNDLSDGSSSVIPTTQQRFATTSFDYSVCTNCTTLTTTTISNYELDLTKPTSTTPAVEDEIYWGIVIPFGTASRAHSGVNTFYAVTD